MHPEILICLIFTLSSIVETEAKSTFSLSNASKTPLRALTTPSTVLPTEHDIYLNGTTTEPSTKSSLTKAKAVFIIAFISATVLIILLIILIAFNVKNPTKVERRERPNDVRPSTR